MVVLRQLVLSGPVMRSQIPYLATPPVMRDLGAGERAVHVAPMLGSALRPAVGLEMVARVRRLADWAVGVKILRGLDVAMPRSRTR